MAIFKYKYGKHGSFYVPGEEIPAKKLKEARGGYQPSLIPPAPPLNPPKGSSAKDAGEKKEKKKEKQKIQRIYEDNDFIIDLFPEEPMIRVSIFKDNHFQDEVFVRKDD